MADSKSKTATVETGGTGATTAEDAPAIIASDAPPAPRPISDRFVTAADSPEPTQDQVSIVRQNAGAIITAAEQIDQMPDSRYKSLALTALEEALMWANKAVFSA